MKIACIGGGPAGLYLGILVKRQAPEHEVVVYERNRPNDTFGFGVVFSDATLGHLAAADPETHAQITAKFARWDDIEIHVRGEVLRSTGHGFCGIERLVLLQILQARAQALGVEVHYEHEIKSLSEVHAAASPAEAIDRLGAAVPRADVIVACDGVASWVRDALAAELQPHVDVRPNTFVWLGCTEQYKAFTFIFKETPHGLMRVHAYPFRPDASTFIVECRERPTFEPSALADIFGVKLIHNRSIWRNFPTVRCGKWHAGNVVLMGDAAHTAHFSIGSGTKLAMEDAIALRDELLATRDVSAALAAYEARRKPEVESLQAAAQASLEWFEGTERYMDMPPVQFAYSLMTRSLRVSHASMHKRDPHLAAGVEQLLGGRPSETAFSLGERRWPSRIVPMNRVTRTVTNLDADVLLVDGDPEDVPARVQNTKWPRWIAARSNHIGHAAQCVRAGAHLIWVSDVPLADRIRNELHVPVAVENAHDPDSVIAAGRADLIVR